MPVLGELLRRHKPENPVPVLVEEFQDRVNKILEEGNEEHFWEAKGGIPDAQEKTGVAWSESVSIRVGRGGAERDIFSLSLRSEQQSFVLQVIHGIPVVLGNGFNVQLEKQQRQTAALEFGIDILSQLSQPKA